ncbi:hypothetical protein M9H77_22795 [Catharanthus roseus]|uniref:Uncharacterized protein n=1 Tax=Catharanthus roseus TaxID=4058 RepID=A0ACC0ASQ4_CATRO|nr:hypothetical protein M9H77_22795 [Catharanthus roseus]
MADTTTRSNASSLADVAKLNGMEQTTADLEKIEQIFKDEEEFEVVCNDLTKTELALVTSVVKLEAQHLAQIAKGVQKLTGAKNVRIKTTINVCSVKENKIRAVQAGIMKLLVELMADVESNMVDKSAFVMSLLVSMRRQGRH